MEYTIFFVFLIASSLTYIIGYNYGKEQGYYKGFDDGYESAKACWENEGDFLNKYNRDTFILYKEPPEIQTIVISGVWILLSFIVIYFLFNPFALEFFVAIGSLLTASIGMTIYYIIKRKRLLLREEREIVFTIVACLVLFYGLIHYHGLTLSAMFLR